MLSENTRDLQRVKFSIRTRPEKIFNTRPEPEEKFYVIILALKIVKTAYNIRISIGYKDNICQIFGINQASFNIFPKKSWFSNPLPTRTLPDFWFESGRVFFVSGTRCRSLNTLGLP